VTTEYHRDSSFGTNMEKEQMIQQIIKMLAEMNAKPDASHKMMMAMLNCNHERIMTPLGKMGPRISRETQRKWTL
jgi:hypothetical protein